MIIENYLFSAVSSGLKKKEELDLGLFFSAIPLKTSAVFTKNKIKAASVKISKLNSRNEIRALIVNSGNANACEGPNGIKDAKRVVALTANALNIKKENVLICSTGVIGERLDTVKIENAFPYLIKSLSLNSAGNFARSIMTTDTFPKIVVKDIFLPEASPDAVSLSMNNLNFKILGIAKGSGMIMPDMATMLAFIFTNIPIKKELADPLFKDCIDYSFNSITVDGDTSTNDSAFLLYPDMQNMSALSSQNQGFKGILDKDLNYDILKDSLQEVCFDLAKMIVEDGEGATKIVSIEVLNAFDTQGAKKVAFTVANSNLVKTMITGEDLNWGRIMAAIGRSKTRIKADSVDIYINNFKIVENSTASKELTSEIEKKVMAPKEINIKIDLKCGKYLYKALTCNLTKGYIDINASYRS
jgi:glutamate N-acetyltransferase/amino-acid N-acetyltransferase